jgi:hypothetical protein
LHIKAQLPNPNGTVKDIFSRENFEILRDAIRTITMKEDGDEQAVKYGLKSSDSLTDLSGVINDYTKNIYHKPSDELNNLFDFEAGAVYVRLNFLISYSVANQDSRPTWNEGDFFGEQE